MAKQRTYAGSAGCIQYPIKRFLVISSIGNYLTYNRETHELSQVKYMEWSVKRKEEKVPIPDHCPSDGSTRQQDRSHVWHNPKMGPTQHGAMCPM